MRNNTRPYTMSQAQRDAAGEFLDAFWSPERKSRYSDLLVALWRDFQSQPDYDEIVRALSDAMKGPRNR